VSVRKAGEEGNSAPLPQPGGASGRYGDMRVAATLSAAAVALTTASRAVAVETRADIATDHLDAADDGGPRTAGVLVHPLSVATGWLGAEFDVACGENVAMSIGAAEHRLFGDRGDQATLGFALYPQRFSFHGIYLHPMAKWQREARAGVAETTFGLGATVGYAWTWAVGATVRLGGGVAYAKALASEGEARLAPTGLRPQMDADIGWVF
jgi:hypothetical protein